MSSRKLSMMVMAAELGLEETAGPGVGASSLLPGLGRGGAAG